MATRTHHPAAIVRHGGSPARLTRRGLLGAAAGGLLLTACGPGPQAQVGDTLSPGPELHVGASLELSGQGAAFGVLQQRALEITVEQFNAKGGVPVGGQRRPLRIDLRDNESETRLARRHMADFAEDPQVCAVIGGSTAETALALATTAQQHRVPLLAIGFGEGVLRPPAERTYTFKLTPDSADVAPRLASLPKQQGLRRVALLTDIGLHGRAGLRAMTDALNKAALTITYNARLSTTPSDLVAAVTRLMEGEVPEAVVLWAGSTETTAAARELRLAGYDGPLFLDPGGVTEETLDERNATMMEGVYAVHPTCLGESTLTNTTTAALSRRDFVYRYAQQYGSFSGFAPYASDALTLITLAAAAAGSGDREQLRTALEQQVVEGIVGTYAYSAERHGGMEPDSLGVFTVSQGDWTRVS
jgi:branched-chain amino acid transport system substrate-binding protein